ncbi:prisilkin-39-like [Photinus pyralis]|uniref:prisilkin-39-like n=1 Tax=Photinus pyralis TaxID=7054 RepID=UPI0012674B43|nr:prisilkin-39-like [Photinus pyralis]
MKCVLVLLYLVNAAFAGALTGSYLPTGGSGGYYGSGSNYHGSYQGGYGHGGLGDGTIRYGQIGLGGNYYGGGPSGYYSGAGRGDGHYAGQFQHTVGGFAPGSSASSASFGEVSYFPKISYDAKSYEHGSVDALPGAASNQVHFYGGPSGSHTRLQIRLGSAPQKTRVLFVKSPDASSSIIPEIVAPQTASEDKTTVYVLSKQQQAHGSITIPSGIAGGNTVQSRPEVYYLKYDNQHDAERAVAQTLGGHGGGEHVVAQDKNTFVRTLEDSHFSRGHGIGGPVYGSHGSGSTGITYTVSGGSKYGTPGASGPY